MALRHLCKEIPSGGCRCLGEVVPHLLTSVAQPILQGFGHFFLFKIKVYLLWVELVLTQRQPQ